MSELEKVKEKMEALAMDIHELGPSREEVEEILGAVYDVVIEDKYEGGEPHIHIEYFTVADLTEADTIDFIKKLKTLRAKQVTEPIDKFIDDEKLTDMEEAL